MKSFLPSTEAGLIAWLKIQLANIDAEALSLNLPADFVTAAKALFQDMLDKFSNADTLTAQTQQANAVKKETKKTGVSSIGDYARQINKNPLCFNWAGQTSPGFCLLTCTFISLFSSGSGLDEQ